MKRRAKLGSARLELASKLEAQSSRKEAECCNGRAYLDPPKHVKEWPQTSECSPKGHCFMYFCCVLVGDIDLMIRPAACRPHTKTDCDVTWNPRSFNRSSGRWDHPQPEDHPKPEV